MCTGLLPPGANPIAVKILIIIIIIILLNEATQRGTWIVFYPRQFRKCYREPRFPLWDWEEARSATP